MENSPSRRASPHHLLGCDADYGLLAITDIDAPQPRERIEELVAIHVTKIRARGRTRGSLPPDAHAREKLTTGWDQGIDGRGRAARQVSAMVYERGA